MTSISSYNGTAALAMLSSYNGSSSTASSLIAAANGTSSSTSSSSTSTTTTKNIAKLTPWDSSVTQTATDKLATKTLSTNSLFSSGLGSGAGSADKDSNDHELFLLYNAVNKLKALADYASSDTISDTMRTKIQKRIESGLKEIDTQARANGLDGATLIAGSKLSSMKTAKLGSNLQTYTTAVLTNGDENTVPTQFQGNVKFSVTVSEDGVSQDIGIDLSEMGSTDRTVGNVANFINSKLAAAGVETRFSRVETTKTSTIKNVADTKQQSLKITVGNGENVSFNPVSDDTETAIYVAGTATYNVNTKDSKSVKTANNADGTAITLTTNTDAKTVKDSVLSRIDLGDDGSTEKKSATSYLATNGLNVKSMTTDADGNLYLIANVDGTYTNPTNTVGSASYVPKDGSDVVLQKVDSTGKVVWSRSLGSEASATGYSIAVSDDGDVAIAGSVDGLGDSQSSTTGNGTDSFVATYNSDGSDQWYYQKGAYGTDQAIDLKYDSDGNLLVLGKTNAAYGGAVTNGGTDVYVQSFNDSGGVNYTKTIGTSGNDTPIGIEVSGNQAYVAWNDADANGHISRIAADTGAFAAADYMTSSNGINSLSGIEVDDSGNVVVSGNSASGKVYDQIRGINMLTGSTTFSEDLNGETVRNFSVNGNLVNVALAGTTNSLAVDADANQTTLKGYSLSDGSQVYSVDALGEANSNVTVVSSTSQSKSLEALGLPQGELSIDNTKSLTDLTGVRTGDYFYISVNGKKDRKITIAQGETMASLQTKIKKVLGTSGTVSLSGTNGNKYLNITAKNTATIEFKTGTANADALASLGMSAGFVTNATTASTTASDTANQIVALQLPEGDAVDVSTKTAATALSSSLSTVLSRIRTAYRAISTDPDVVAQRNKDKASAKAASSGTSSSAAVASYNAKAKEYAAALAKLTA